MKIFRFQLLLFAGLAGWVCLGCSAQTMLLNTDQSFVTATTNLTYDYGWCDGHSHFLVDNSGGTVVFGDGVTSVGRFFIGLFYSGSYFGDGNLTLSSTGVPGTFYLNGYNSGDSIIGRLGQVSGGYWTGSLTITGGVSVVVGSHQLKYEGGTNTVNVEAGSLDYSTAHFGFNRSNLGNNPHIRHILGGSGSIVVNALISNAASFSNWAVTNNGASVGANDVTVEAASGFGLVFAQNTPISGKTTIATVAVLQFPAIVTGPQSATYILGDFLSPLNVTANGSQPLSYQWLKNGTALPGSTNATYNLVTPLTVAGGGSYGVIVSNAASSVTSAPPAAITVLNVTNAFDQAAAIVGRYQSVFSSPPAQIPTDGAMDAPLMGNGNMLAALNWQTNTLQFYINRSDQWVMDANGGGGPLPLARLDVSLPGQQGASYNARQQNFLHGLTTGQFSNSTAVLNMESAVSATNDLLWVLLWTSSGSVTGQANLFPGGATSITSITPISNDLQLGREQFGSGRWYLNGLMDDVRVYDRTLSATEISILASTQNVSGNLIRWWTFENVTNSTVPDMSGSGANGTLLGGLILTNGVTGSAVNLNGSTGYVDTPPCQVQTALTASAFINVRSLPPDDDVQYIFSNGEWDNGWSLGISGGYLRMAVGTAYVQASTVVTTNQWIHVASTYDGNVIRAYVNGVLVAASRTSNNSGVSGATQYVERDFLTGVSMPDAAAAALQVVGSPDGSFVVTSNQPVLLVLSSQSLMVTNNFLTTSINRVNGFQMADLAPLRNGHESWWSNFWGKSFVEIPDQTLMQRYYLSQYVMASASRNPNFPPGLQGWVTTDNPEWNGDYHLNYDFEAPFYGALLLPTISNRPTLAISRFSILWLPDSNKVWPNSVSLGFICPWGLLRWVILLV